MPVSERPGEHLVLLLLLPGAPQLAAGEDARWWTVAEIEAELGDCDPAGIRYAIDGLVAEGVAAREYPRDPLNKIGERVRASRCALHINRMGAICV